MMVSLLLSSVWPQPGLIHETAFFHETKYQVFRQENPTKIPCFPQNISDTWLLIKTSSFLKLEATSQKDKYGSSWLLWKFTFLLCKFNTIFLRNVSWQKYPELTKYDCLIQEVTESLADTANFNQISSTCPWASYRLRKSYALPKSTVFLSISYKTMFFLWVGDLKSLRAPAILLSNSFSAICGGDKKMLLRAFFSRNFCTRVHIYGCIFTLTCEYPFYSVKTALRAKNAFRGLLYRDFPVKFCPKSKKRMTGAQVKTLPNVFPRCSFFSQFWGQLGVFWSVCQQIFGLWLETHVRNLLYLQCSGYSYIFCR